MWSASTGSSGEKVISSGAHLPRTPSRCEKNPAMNTTLLCGNVQSIMCNVIDALWQKNTQKEAGVGPYLKSVLCLYLCSNFFTACCLSYMMTRRSLTAERVVRDTTGSALVLETLEPRYHHKCPQRMPFYFWPGRKLIFFYDKSYNSHLHKRILYCNHYLVPYAE